MTWTKCKSNK